MDFEFYWSIAFLCAGTTLGFCSTFKAVTRSTDTRFVKLPRSVCLFEMILQANSDHFGRDTFTWDSKNGLLVDHLYYQIFENMTVPAWVMPALAKKELVFCRSLRTRPSAILVRLGYGVIYGNVLLKFIDPRHTSRTNEHTTNEFLDQYRLAFRIRREAKGAPSSPIQTRDSWTRNLWVVYYTLDFQVVEDSSASGRELKEKLKKQEQALEERVQLCYRRQGLLHFQPVVGQGWMRLKMAKMMMNHWGRNVAVGVVASLVFRFHGHSGKVSQFHVSKKETNWPSLVELVNSPLSRNSMWEQEIFNRQV